MKQFAPYFAAAGFGLLLAACGGSDAPEDAPVAGEEAAVETEADTPADTPAPAAAPEDETDPGNGSVTGTDLELPEGFPSDVALPEGVSITATMPVPPDGFSIQGSSDLGVEALGEAVREAMEGEGWTALQPEEDSAQMVRIQFEKDGRVANVNIIDSGETSTLQLVTMTKPDE